MPRTSCVARRMDADHHSHSQVSVVDLAQPSKNEEKEVLSTAAPVMPQVLVDKKKQDKPNKDDDSPFLSFGWPDYPVIKTNPVPLKASTEDTDSDGFVSFVSSEVEPSRSRRSTKEDEASTICRPSVLSEYEEVEKEQDCPYLASIHLASPSDAESSAGADGAPPAAPTTVIQPKPLTPASFGWQDFPVIPQEHKEHMDDARTIYAVTTTKTTTNQAMFQNSHLSYGSSLSTVSPTTEEIDEALSFFLSSSSSLTSSSSCSLQEEEVVVDELTLNEDKDRMVLSDEQSNGTSCNRHQHQSSILLGPKLQHQPIEKDVQDIIILPSELILTHAGELSFLPNN